MDVSPSTRWETVGWALLGVALSALVSLVLLSFVGSLAVAVFLYYATRPANRWLFERTGLRRTSAITTLSLVGVPILAVVGYAGYIGVQELDQFLQATRLEQLRSAIRPYLGPVAPLSRQALVDLLRGNLSRLSSALGTVLRWLLRLFVVLTVAYYLLRDDEKIAGWFRDAFDDNPTVVAFTEGVDRDVSTLYTGNLLIIAASAAIAIGVFLGLNVIAPSEAGIRYPVLLGLLIGVGTLIPAVGMKIVYLPYAAILFWRSWTTTGSPLWFPAVFVAVTLVFVDLLPDTIVRSYVASGEYHMGLVMLAYVLGAAVFGWYGIFLAPLILVASLHFARDVFPQLV